MVIINKYFKFYFGVNKTQIKFKVLSLLYKYFDNFESETIGHFNFLGYCMNTYFMGYKPYFRHATYTPVQLIYELSYRLLCPIYNIYYILYGQYTNIYCTYFEITCTEPP